MGLENPSNWIQLGVTGAALFFVLLRLERALGALAKEQCQTNQILLLMLTRLGITDTEALKKVNHSGNGSGYAAMDVQGSNG